MFRVGEIQGAEGFRSLSIFILFCLNCKGNKHPAEIGTLGKRRLVGCFVFRVSGFEFHVSCFVFRVGVSLRRFVSSSLRHSVTKSVVIRLSFSGHSVVIRLSFSSHSVVLCSGGFHVSCFGFRVGGFTSSLRLFVSQSLRPFVPSSLRH